MHNLCAIAASPPAGRQGLQEGLIGSKPISAEGAAFVNPS
jgi:hypothetical protein